jgi:release factor glutamine methyltransferase
MTFNEARTELVKQLTPVYDSNELNNIADLVIEHISGLTRMEQLSTKKNYLTCEQLEDIDSITERLKKNEPVQYVLGYAWFAGMKFKVNKNVLIPRPETEELADWIISDFKLKTMPAGQPVADVRIIDVGTGSGCIAVTLKKKNPAASVTAIDVCSEAIFTATENAAIQNTEIDFRLTDFLDETKWNDIGVFDIIVSNPPYVKTSEAAIMQERVKSFEPHLALFVPDDDALLFYKKLARFSKLFLKPGGALYVEINEAHAKAVEICFTDYGLKKVIVKKDMQGKERMVKATSEF